jgi:predicted DNA-binding protein
MSNFVQYGIRLPEELYQRLKTIPKGQRAKHIRDWIETGLCYQDGDVHRLQSEIEEIEQNLAVKKQLLSKKHRHISEEQQESNKRNQLINDIDIQYINSNRSVDKPTDLDISWIEARLSKHDLAKVVSIDDFLSKCKDKGCMV